MAFGTDASNRMGSPQAVGATFYNKTIDQSLRFNDDDTAYLYRTPSSAGNRKTFTLSVWIKVNPAATNYPPIFNADTSAPDSVIRLGTTGEVQFVVENGGGGNALLITNRKLRDASAWYHLVCAMDTTQDIGDRRLRIWINGEEETSFSSRTNPDKDDQYDFNNTVIHKIGAQRYASYWDGYMAEMHWIDGTVYGPEYFGENKNGVWIPKKVSGVTYGTNGFHMDFADTADLGKNIASGNTYAKFEISGLASSDVLPDSPTNNMAVLSSVNKYTNAVANDVREGGLEERGNSSGYAGTVTFDAEDENGYYFEVTHTGTPGSGCTHGMMNFTDSINQYGGVPGDSDRSGWWGVYRRGAGGGNTFWYYLDGVETGDLGVAGSANDVWMYLIKAGKFYIGRNGTWFNSGDPAAGTGFYDSGLTGTDWTIFSGNGVNVTGGHKIRVSRDTWSHGDASYKEVKAFNLAEPTFTPRNESIENSFFYTTLYEGNGTGQRVGQFLPLNEVKTVNNAIRFEAGDEPSLTKTFLTTQTNTKIMTVSVWVKRANLGIRSSIMFAKSGSSGWLTFLTDDKLYWNPYNTGYNGFKSTRVFRDTSAWYHIVATADSENQSGVNIHNVYVNGEQLTHDGGSSYVPDDTATKFLANGLTTYIGDDTDASTYHFDGYMAEMHVIDGSVVAHTEFGQTDPSTEKWIPKTYSGTHGTNGFHLEFLNNEVGADSAGSNNFTPSNLTTANTVIDTPTKNYPTFDSGNLNSWTLSRGNLYASVASNNLSIKTTVPIFPNSGKWYWEVLRVDTASGGGDKTFIIGLTKTDSVLSDNPYSGTNNYSLYDFNGTLYFEGTNLTPYGSKNQNADDIHMIAYDSFTGATWFGVNGTWYNSATASEIANGNTTNAAFIIPKHEQGHVPFLGRTGGTNAAPAVINFGQDPSFAGELTGANIGTASDGLGSLFKYAPPTGYKALNNDNLPAKGTRGIARRKTPAITWIKNRDSTDSHMLFDSLRGAGKVAHPDLNASETTEPNTLQKFLPGGFQIGNDVQVNTSGESYVAWNWCMHDDVVEEANSAISGSGFTDAKRLVDKRVGLSIVTYTASAGTGTIDHGLGQTPDMIIATDRGHNVNWFVWHTGLANASAGTHIMNLDTGAAEFNPGINHLNDTAPTASAFAFGGYMGAHADTSASGQTKMFYAFKSVPGFSKFGFYTGNAAADGTYVHFGFKPAWLMIADTTTTNIEWNIFDTTRYPTNVMNSYLAAASNAAEAVNVSTRNLDFVSNGIKFRDQYAQNYAARHIYMAFAEQPFKYANAR
jgi:hypothetical protein